MELAVLHPGVMHHQATGVPHSHRHDEGQQLHQHQLTGGQAVQHSPVQYAPPRHGPLRLLRNLLFARQRQGSVEPAGSSEDEGMLTVVRQRRGRLNRRKRQCRQAPETPEVAPTLASVALGGTEVTGLPSLEDATCTQATDRVYDHALIHACLATRADSSPLAQEDLILALPFTSNSMMCANVGLKGPDFVSAAQPGAAYQPASASTAECTESARPNWFASMGRRVQRLLSRLAGLRHQLRPKTAGHNDKTVSERVINVVSCAPFFLVSHSVLRSCTHAASRRFGHMFLLVSGVAAAYHGCVGPITRRVMRLADHWTIALTSCALRAAVYTPHEVCAAAVAPARKAFVRCFAVANTLTTPFMPSLVSSINFALVEARCLSMALRAPATLLPLWACHTVIGGVASAVFFLEDVVAKDGNAVPGWHAVWHLLSAAGIWTTVPFLRHLEAPRSRALLTA